MLTRLQGYSILIVSLKAYEYFIKEHEMMNKPTFEDLRVRTGLKKGEFLRFAEITTSTYRRIEKKDPTVGLEMLYRCLNALNKRLETDYDLDDIDH